MNDASPEERQQSAVTQTEKPGTVLREAREQQQLSVDDIYQRIHLEPKIIDAIEADDYSIIPTATYARGYLRTYAKTLGLDADYVVSLYNTDNAPPPPEIIPEVKPPSQVSSSDKPVKAFTYLISLALVLLLLIWYQSNFIVDKDDADSASTEDDKQTPAIINNTSTDFDVVIHPEGWQTPKTDEPAITEASANDVESEIDMPAEIPAEPAEQAGSTADLEQLKILPVDSTDTTRTYITPGPDTIELNINEDSWIEIYDANEERVFMDLGKQGERFKIKGTSPFSLILGYAPGVSIKFNNENFDPEPYSNNGVARFQLPTEE